MRVSHLSTFRTDTGRQAYMAAYDRVLGELWPVAAESVYVNTRFGCSHALVCGPRTAKPLILLPGAGLSATSWYPNIATFSEHFRVYALDLIFDRGRGRQTRLLHGSEDCVSWLADTLDGLGIHQAPVVGLSQGGWVAASAARFAPERITRLVLLAPAATLRPFRLPFWLLFRGLQDLLPKGDPVKQARRTSNWSVSNLTNDFSSRLRWARNTFGSNDPRCCQQPSPTKAFAASAPRRSCFSPRMRSSTAHPRHCAGRAISYLTWTATSYPAQVTL